MSFETIILRFRDLVTEDDETIKHHKDKIASSGGCVWWGWWKKGNEQIPFDEISILCGKMIENPITIYLLDSGQGKLYIAECTEIKYSKTERIPSPDVDKTPKYYNDQKYYAWFKFKRIEECSTEELRKYSYTQVKSLFKENTSNYEDFNNKRIYNAQELIQQNRTMWFVRQYDEDNDKDCEIRLLDSDYVEPIDFSKKYYETRSDTLLWLSDLHFQNSGIFKIKVENENDITLTKHLQQAYGELQNVGGLIITGDITSYGKSEGFDIAKDFLTDVNRQLVRKLTSNNIIFCPGNHDFKRIEKECNQDDILKNVSEYPDSIAPYKDFYHSIHHLNPNKYFSCGRKLLMNTGRTVEIVALNSNIFQQYKNFEGHGFISGEQLDSVAKEMGWDERIPTNAIRIAVMHHHYLPTCLVEQADISKPSSVVYDAERLMQWLLKYDVKILLHGHKHQSFFAKVGRTNNSDIEVRCDNCNEVYVIAMGSTGATNCQNKFATLTFKTNEIELKYFVIHSDNIDEDKCVQTIHIPI